MIFIRTMKLTLKQAKELEHLGFRVLLSKMFCGNVDEYMVYVR